GRTHDVINVGGEKVLPVEVEDVIMNVEGVENCRVYGADSMITGQIVVAEVVTQQKDRKTLKKIIFQTCRQKLQAYKVPAKLRFINKIEISQRLKTKRQ
ncbi:MAG: long-chain fatty acid--CoA ligase, partial [Bacteroidales bacterium]|nr:long-chain fatty acid--CoA ligase [Bacteroidales bacterium]